MTAHEVLVTGGTGFIGAHTIARLLADGYAVRTTLRDPARAAEVRVSLRVAGIDADTAPLSFAVADLTRDAGWDEAVAGCACVLHVASPFPAAAAGRDADLIAPARDGTLRVLRAAKRAGVARVVVTSSFGAVGYGHPARATPFTEADWTDLTGADVTPYIRSKTLAERAAWDYAAAEGLEIAVVNPVGVFGPLLGTDVSSSILLVKALMDGSMPATARIYFGVVDVRDVADLHVRAMTSPHARGERFLATAGPAVSLRDVARIVRARLPDASARVPRFQLPDALVRVLARFSPTLRFAVPQLGVVRNASAEKAQRLLGWTPRSAEDALVASAEGLVRFGLVPQK